MNVLSIHSLANGFKGAGVLVAFPSIAVLVLYAVHEIRRRFSAGSPGSTSFGENPDAILLMLMTLTESIGALARFAGGLGHLLLTGLAILGGAGLVLGVTLWCTGRGLQAQADWARLSAGVLLGLAMLPSLALLFPANNIARAFLLFVVIACALGLHTLWTGGAPANR
jgi:hypothetical protein